MGLVQWRLRPTWPKKPNPFNDGTDADGQGQTDAAQRATEV